MKSRHADRARGFVYVLINPAWPEWLKIGMSSDCDERLNAFNAASPLRDYSMPLVFSCWSPLSVESRALSALRAMGHETSGEWVKCSLDAARQAVCSALNVVVDDQLTEISREILADLTNEPQPST